MYRAKRFRRRPPFDLSYVRFILVRYVPLIEEKLSLGIFERSRSVLFLPFLLHSATQSLELVLITTVFVDMLPGFGSLFIKSRFVCLY